MKAKPILAVAIILAGLGFLIEYTPLTQELHTTPIPTFYTTETPYQVTSTLISTPLYTKTLTLERITDPPDDSLGSYDISEVVYERNGDMLVTYLTLSHGNFEYRSGFFIFIDSDGDEKAEYYIGLIDGSKCGFWDYDQGESADLVFEPEYELQMSGPQWIAWTPLSRIGGQNEFYSWASAYTWMNDEWVYEDSVPEKSEIKINLQSEQVVSQAITIKETFEMTTIFTASSTFTSTYVVNTPLKEGGLFSFLLFIVAAGISASAIIFKPESIEIEHCVKCGAEVSKKDLFCGQCGTKRLS